MDPAVLDHLDGLFERRRNDLDLLAFFQRLPLLLEIVRGEAVHLLGEETGYLANRIVGIAYPGSVVVSEEMRNALRDDSGVNLRSLRSHTLRDIGRVRLWRLRRDEDVDHDSLLEKARLRREVGREWIEDHFGATPDEPSSEAPDR